MARYEHLPIYRAAFELTVYIESLVSRMSKRFKYALGQRLQKSALEIVVLIVKVQNVPLNEKRPLLSQLGVEIEVLNLLHLSKEMNALPTLKSYEHSARLTVSVAKQAAGWLKSCKNSQKWPESNHGESSPIF